MRYTDPDGKSLIGGLLKTVQGAVLTGLGTLGGLACAAGAAALYANDATVIGVLDDALAFALSAVSLKAVELAAGGLLLAAEGAAETADGMAEAVDNLIQSA